MDQSMLSLGVVLALAFIAVIILVIFFQFIPFGLWLTALFSGVRVSFFTLFGMRFRRVDPKAIVFPLISSHKAGIVLGVNDLEGHYLAGGNVQRVVNALISADKAGNCGLLHSASGYGKRHQTVYRIQAAWIFEPPRNR